MAALMIRDAAELMICDHPAFCMDLQQKYWLGFVIWAEAYAISQVAYHLTAAALKFTSDMY